MGCCENDLRSYQVGSPTTSGKAVQEAGVGIRIPDLLSLPCSMTARKLPPLWSPHISFSGFPSQQNERFIYFINSANKSWAHFLGQAWCPWGRTWLSRVRTQNISWGPCSGKGRDGKAESISRGSCSLISVLLELRGGPDGTGWV